MNAPGLIRYGKTSTRNGSSWHALDELRRGRITAGVTACGREAELTMTTEADERALRLAGAPVCGNCRDVLDNRRRHASVAFTPTRATGPEGGTMPTTATAPKTTTKKASTRLLDPSGYGKASATRLREERATISNRLSGVNTQIKRTDDPAKKADLEARRATLLDLRGKVNEALASKTNDVAEATGARASASPTKPKAEGKAKTGAKKK